MLYRKKGHITQKFDIIAVRKILSFLIFESLTQKILKRYLL